MQRVNRAALTLFCIAALLPLLCLRGASAQETREPDPAASLGPYLESLRRARDSLLNAGDAEGALEPGRIVISAQESATPAELAADEAMLAVILAELSRFDEAELKFLDVIASLQSAEGPAAASLVTPLRLLGRTYIRARRFPQAITALSEARAVSRRTAGLFNIDQTGIIDDLTTAHLGQGDTAAARELQIARLETAQRQFGTDDPRVIPYHFDLADYYSRSRLLGSAREQFDSALAIAQTSGDAEAELRALRNLASLELQTGTERTATERLSETVTSSAASSHELGLAEAVLGDAALLEEETDNAASHFARAWQLIAAGDVVSPEEFFADPAIIRLITPASAVDLAARSLPYAWGTIALEFDVAENGRVAKVTGVGAEPADLMESAYVERLTSAWFRPALLEGKPVESEGVVFTHYFRYYVEPDKDAD